MLIKEFNSPSRVEVVIFRQDISAQGLYSIVRREYSKIEDPRQSRKTSVSYVDALMSAMALFALKSPSLLAFEKDVRQDEVVLGNVKRIFHMSEVPSDTAMREIIDEIPLDQLHKPFTRIFAALQRGKDLEPYLFMDGHYLVALDGTGYFSSPSVHCDGCCVKNHRNGAKMVYHQAVAGVLIHPDMKVVIPFSPEPMTKQDGHNKNDCEQRATGRFSPRGAYFWYNALDANTRT